jgi:hypothetical protein
MNRYLTKIASMIKFTEPIPALKDLPSQVSAKLQSHGSSVPPSQQTPQPVYRWPGTDGDGTSTVA